MFIMDEEGQYLSDTLIISSEYDRYGASADKGEHEIAAILEMAVSPDISTRGMKDLLFMGIFLSFCCVITILFEDQLFRWNLRFQIRDPQNAEPSEWELFSRWLSWIVFTILSIAAYIVGLTAA